MRRNADEGIRDLERAVAASPHDHALADRLDQALVRSGRHLEARDERELWAILERLIRRAREAVPKRNVTHGGFRQAAIRALRGAVEEGLRSVLGATLVEVFRCDRCHRIARLRGEHGCCECDVVFCHECENEGPGAHQGYHTKCRDEYFTTWVGAAAHEDASRNVTICLRAQDRPVRLGPPGARVGFMFPELTRTDGLSAPALDRLLVPRSVLCQDPQHPQECVFPPPLVRMVSWCEELHRWDGTPVRHQCRVLPLEILRAETQGDGEHVLQLLHEFELDGPMTYRLGDLLIEGATCNERTSTGHLGEIEIGGDKGDVLAREATGHGDGVTLHGARLLTTALGLSDEAAADVARDVVMASYESVGDDTFRQSHRER